MPEIKVLETTCYPCKYTVTKDGKTPLDNGDFSLWFVRRRGAQIKADQLNRRRSAPKTSADSFYS